MDYLEPKIYVVAIPFVGTLNDKEIATPVDYMDHRGNLKSGLEETPGIKNRKETMRYYLRYLDERFFGGERLFLSVYFVTRDKRTIDCTNVIDLIQNAGNKVIWDDDSQFIYTQSQRLYIEKQKERAFEFIVIYVGHIPDEHINNLSFTEKRFLYVATHFKSQLCGLSFSKLEFKFSLIRKYYRSCIGSELNLL